MPDSPRDALARRIGEYPKEALAYSAAGMIAASKLSEEIRGAVLQKFIETFKTGTRRLAGAAVRPIAKVSERESEQLAFAYSLLIGLLLETNATADDVVNAGKGRLFEPAQEVTGKSIVDAIYASREEIKATVDRAQLAGEVLPSLYSLDIAVDMRIRVSEGELKTFVPVAVVHLDTDITGLEVWFQLSRGEVEEMVHKLSRCLEDMKLAETLITQKH
jgi:hypothetical protein